MILRPESGAFVQCFNNTTGNSVVADVVVMIRSTTWSSDSLGRPHTRQCYWFQTAFHHGILVRVVPYKTWWFVVVVVTTICNSSSSSSAFVVCAVLDLKIIIKICHLPLSNSGPSLKSIQFRKGNNFGCQLIIIWWYLLLVGSVFASLLFVKLSKSFYNNGFVFDRIETAGTVT